MSISSHHPSIHYEFIDVDMSRHAIAQARTARKFGLILGTLGRQGSTHIQERLEALLKGTGRPYVVVCLSEIQPAKLALFRDVDAYVLSFDFAAFSHLTLLLPLKPHVHAQLSNQFELIELCFDVDQLGASRLSASLHRLGLRFRQTSSDPLRTARGPASHRLASCLPHGFLRQRRW